MVITKDIIIFDASGRQAFSENLTGYGKVPGGRGRRVRGCWLSEVKFRSEQSIISASPKEGQCQRMFKLLHNCTHLTH